MEKNRTKLLTLLQNNNPICKSNNSQNSHTVFRGQIRTLTSYQSEVSPRTISGSENHYMDILMSEIPDVSYVKTDPEVTSDE